MEDKVKELIEDIRPRLQMDGGDIEFIGLEDGIVKVRLQGACHGCPSASYTLKLGVERYIQEKLPEIKEVVNV
ncbi:MAG: hypothetical protein CVV50_01175 [Spirochaetae bacterium HGW-Spirochaetae-6]|nr:MAG: hypothetical protein CVV50_01175 [Spirochaetae bacterium HGW-Spirochaetae-6]